MADGDDRQTASTMAVSETRNLDPQDRAIGTAHQVAMPRRRASHHVTIAATKDHRPDEDRGLRPERLGEEMDEPVR